MRYFKSFILLFIACTLLMPGFSQDTLYARKVDSLWVHSYDWELLKKKRETVEKKKVAYSYYKSSRSIRSIVVLDKTAKENLLFFFLQDTLVMISPSGQQPYFVQNGQIVYAKEPKHTSQQLQSLIAKAYAFLERGYKKIKRASG